MKLYPVILIALFSSLCLGLNAQVFIGGGIRFIGSTTENQKADKPFDKESTFGVTISPNVGVFLSEKVAIGIQLNFSTITEKRGVSGVTTMTTYKQSSLGASPYIRYYAWNWNKFSVFFQGNIGVDFSKSTMEVVSTVTDGPKATDLYINVFPALSYDISDKLSLETSINFLSLGYNQSITEYDAFTDKTSGFYFGAGLDNIVTIGTIKVGAIYKF